MPTTHDRERFGERRQVADTTMTMAEFPSGVMIFLAGATTNERGIEDVIRGDRANLTHSSDRGSFSDPTGSVRSAVRFGRTMLL